MMIRPQYHFNPASQPARRSEAMSASRARPTTIGPTGPLMRIEAASAPQKVQIVARGAGGPSRAAA